MIRMRCKSCSKVVGVPTSLCGKQVKCPHCGGVNRVPHLKVAQAIETPAVAEQPKQAAAHQAETGPDRSAQPPSVADAPQIQVDVEGVGASRLARRKPNAEGAGKRTLLMVGGAVAVAGILLAMLAYAVLDGRPDAHVAARPEPDNRPPIDDGGISDRTESPQAETKAAHPLPDEVSDELVDVGAPDETPGGIGDPPQSHVEEPVAGEPDEAEDRPAPVEPEATFVMPEQVAEADPPAEEAAPLDVPSVPPPTESLPAFDATGPSIKSLIPTTIPKLILSLLV